MKKLFFVFTIILLLATPSLVGAGGGGGGYDEYGYNRQARIFNGTGLSYCKAKGFAELYCQLSMAPYANDKLIMKWNAEWDRGKAENWSKPPYNAWLSNEWNGAMPKGSGEVWHYKSVWVGDCAGNPGLVPSGGYCLWGQFATVMDHGTDKENAPRHLWFAHATSSGYGSYP